MLNNEGLKDRIEKILINYPNCRDDDRALMGNVWQREMIEAMGFERYNTPELPRNTLGRYVNGSLSSAESIRRTRQKLQELHPKLRGKKYEKRQKHQEQVKEEIRNF